MDIFNNRELALAFWITVAIAFAASRHETRHSFREVWRAFSRRQILIPLSLMAAYVILVVVALHAIGLWHVGQLKNTILWTMTVAVFAFFRIPKIAADEHYFRNAIKDNFKIVAVLEFVVAFYTLPIWAELVLVPVATFLVAAQSYAEGRDEYAVAERVLNVVLGLIGGALVFYAGYELVTDLRSFARPTTLTDFSLPIILSLLFLPFLLLLSLYLNYESAFQRLSWMVEDEALRRYAKRAALFSFNIRANLLRHWLHNVAVTRPANRQQVQASIAEVKRSGSSNKSRPRIQAHEGWSPDCACSFLTEARLACGDYHRDPLSEAEWYASSPYLEVGKGTFPDNIAYYVEGDEHIARRLKLVVNFNDRETMSSTRELFGQLAAVLFRAALGQEAPDKLTAGITEELPLRIATEEKVVRLVREPWPSGRGHTLRLFIEIESA